MSYPRDGVLAAITAIVGAISLVMLPDPDTEPAAGPVEPADPAPAAPQPVEPEPAEPEPVIPDPAEPEPAPLVDGAGQMFVYDPPGALTELDFRTNTITPGFSGTGWQGTSAYSDSYVFAPHMAWPLEGAGFANSQVYRPGGMLGGMSAAPAITPIPGRIISAKPGRAGMGSVPVSGVIRGRIFVPPAVRGTAPGPITRWRWPMAISLISDRSLSGCAMKPAAHTGTCISSTGSSVICRC